MSTTDNKTNNKQPTTTKPASPPQDFEEQERQMAIRASKFRESAPEKEGVIPTLVDIYSDGTRMQGCVWKPKTWKDGQKLPAILLCHGWGGKRNHLDYSYGPQFAKAGYIALTFDYRGWGESDGVLVNAQIPGSKQPKPDVDGTTTMKVRIVRKIIDPEWQLRDIDSALNYLVTVDGVDVNRIGIWGSSFGGGNALAIAARDARVKVVVCQIGSINTHINWINRHPERRGEQSIRKLASEHARGEVMPWNLSKPAGLDGMPNLPKVVFEHTRNTVDSVRNIRVPVMLLAAEKEELFPNEKNSSLVYDMIKDRVPATLEFLAGTHYDAYGASFGKSVERALHWFNLYIGNVTMQQNKL
jgi:dienelactone hydrolase